MAEDTDETTRLWHKRLGHVSERGLVELEKQGFLGKNKLVSCNSVKIVYWVRLHG